MRTLFDILYDADAIQIDDIFVRYFHMEYEHDEEPDDIVLQVEEEVDYNMYEYSFTIEELETAVKRSDSEGWDIVGDGEHAGSTITPYKLNEITA